MFWKKNCSIYTIVFRVWLCYLVKCMLHYVQKLPSFQPHLAKYLDWSHIVVLVAYCFWCQTKSYFYYSRINPLALVEIIAFIVPKISDPKEAITFLETTEPKVKQNSEAVSLCKVLEGQIFLEKLKDQVATKVEC